jgi:hypothetical protein
LRTFEAPLTLPTAVSCWKGLCVALLAAGAAAVAGCGGGGGHYTLPPTLDCLRTAGVNASRDTANPLFGSADGSIDADFNAFDIYIGFARDSGQAHELAQGVDAVGSAFQSKGEVVTRGNVAYYANDTSLNRDAQSIVDSCLKGDTDGAKRTFVKFVAAHPPPAYPQAFVDSFMRSCSASGGEGQCRCLIEKAQARYTLAEFQELSRAVNDATRAKHAEAQQLISDCQGG